jgi:hypothetical protein
MNADREIISRVYLPDPGCPQNIILDKPSFFVTFASFLSMNVVLGECTKSSNDFGLILSVIGRSDV